MKVNPISSLNEVDGQIPGFSLQAWLLRQKPKNHIKTEKKQENIESPAVSISPAFNSISESFQGVTSYNLTIVIHEQVYVEDCACIALVIHSIKKTKATS